MICLLCLVDWHTVVDGLLLESSIAATQLKSANSNASISLMSVQMPWVVQAVSSNSLPRQCFGLDGVRHEEYLVAGVATCKSLQ